MWYIYTTGGGSHYPLELGYRAMSSAEIVHDYDRLTIFCKDGCESYNSGGCPPWAPRFEVVQEQYPYAVLVFARFYTRFLPEQFRSSPNPSTHYRFQDIILTRLLSHLGYRVRSSCGGQAIFLNAGHCPGCGDTPCSFLLGEQSCRNSRARVFNIGATGIDAEATMRKFFGIQLQWQTRGAHQEVEYIIKVMGFFTTNSREQNNILDQIPGALKHLPSTHLALDDSILYAVLKEKLTVQYLQG
ncbi:MAG TPA: DUF2284 domain-containing protein [Syntrophomonadaceae bacterium]|nr:DUF2284 domain-containing protein [Syntrophomonadaceae bacterium]